MNRSLSPLAIALVALGLSTAALAQPAPPATPPDFSKVEIKTTALADNLYLLEGQGGTISVLTGPEGVLLVDAQFAPLTEKLAAAIRKVSNQPIRFLVNTHVHGDHTGGNANFAKLGATLLSRDELRDRLARPRPNANGVPGQPAPAQALPSITYDGPVVDRAALVAQGKTVDEVIAARPTADFDAQVPQAAQTSERFIRWLYADLKAAL